MYFVVHKQTLIVKDKVEIEMNSMSEKDYNISNSPYPF